MAPPTQDFSLRPLADLPNRLFVTGTDTNVGKTVVSAILAAGWRGSYWKPIQSGLEQRTDSELVQFLAGLPAARVLAERFRLSAPLSPHAAAARDGITIKVSDFRLPACRGPLIVEGAGGLLVPLNETEFMVDLMASLRLPVLLVARTTLGTINHTLLSIEALRNRGLEICGLVLNGPANPINQQALARYGKVPILFEVGPFKEVTPAAVQNFAARLFETKR